MKNLAFLLTQIFCIPAPAFAALDYYKIDSVHTRVGFHVMHAGFSPSIGTVSGPEGHIWFDDHDISKSSVKIRIPVNRLDLGDVDWNTKILSPTYLSADKYPEATYESTSVQAIDEKNFTVEGTLKLSGKSTPIRFNVQLNANKRHPLSFKQTIGLQANAQFSRKSIGVDAWPSLIDDTVFITVAIEANKEPPPKQGTEHAE
ncbi:MAG: polyisoprenoid-binding protein [Arenimonas sp.]|nr:polyisoprenoid-binding protein [Arenimonas sp.]